MNISDYCIQENAPLAEALRRLDQTGGTALFVVREGRLVAALTDGDVRRHILKTGNMQATAKEIANYKPRYVKAGEEDEARRMIRRKRLDAVPVVDEDLSIVSIVFPEGALQIKRGPFSLPVVINAGGKGTRLYPYTKVLPKPLIPVGELPITEIIINHFRDMGCTQFYMIVNHKKNMIKAYFNELEKPDYSLTFVDEDKPLGTGGGLGLLRGMLDQPFVFINCDTVIEEDFDEILKVHQQNRNLVTMITSVKRFEIPYGIVETGDNGSIQAFREKPQLSYLVNTGCYLVEPQVIETISPEEPIGFPAVIERLRQAGRPVGIYPVSQDAWLDMGQMEELEKMRKRLDGK